MTKVKFHADIVNQATKEVVHCMRDEGQQLFCEQVERSLNQFYGI